MKINRTILEKLIREELSLMSEGLTPDEHQEVINDPETFAKSLGMHDPRFKEAFFFHSRIIGSKSTTGALFSKNITRLERTKPAMIRDLKQNLAKAFADIGMGGIGAKDIIMVQAKDDNWMIRVSYQNIWQKVPRSDPPEYKFNNSPITKKLLSLDWKPYVVLPADQDPATMKRGTRAGTRRGRVASPGKQQVKGSNLYKQTIGQLGGLRGILGLEE